MMPEIHYYWWTCSCRGYPGTHNPVIKHFISDGYSWNCARYACAIIRIVASRGIQETALYWENWFTIRATFLWIYGSELLRKAITMCRKLRPCPEFLLGGFDFPSLALFFFSFSSFFPFLSVLFPSYPFSSFPFSTLFGNSATGLWRSFGHKHILTHLRLSKRILWRHFFSRSSAMKLCFVDLPSD